MDYEKMWFKVKSLMLGPSSKITKESVLKVMSQIEVDEFSSISTKPTNKLTSTQHLATFKSAAEGQLDRLEIGE